MTSVILPFSPLVAQFAALLHREGLHGHPTIPELELKGSIAESVPLGLHQLQITFPYSTRHRTGQVQSYNPPIIAFGAALRIEPAFGKAEGFYSGTIWDFLAHAAGLAVDKLARAHPDLRVVKGLETPQGVYESAHEQFNGTWVRGVTDYWIGADLLVTRFDLLLLPEEYQL